MFSRINLIVVFALAIIVTFPKYNYAQKKENDSVVQKSHSPMKATWLSLAPGAGQIYNKKYWKLPIVYAGFGVTGYFAFSNRSEYKLYNEAYVCSTTLGDECTNELALKYDSSQLKTIRDYYRRNMELSFILMGVWYILQMLDATVDAHLYYWNVDDNLSVRLTPVIQSPVIPNDFNFPNKVPAHNGLKISVNF